jgi:hypothetical protein
MCHTKNISDAVRLFKGFRNEVFATGFFAAVENCSGSKRMNRRRQKKIPHVTEKSQTTSIAQKLCLSMTLVNIPARKKHLPFRVRANHAKHCKH